MIVLEEHGEKKKDLIREIIRELHGGLSGEETQKRIEREVGTISSAEIAEIEQSLIEESISVNEIRRFCNVHTLMFQSTLGLTSPKTGSVRKVPPTPSTYFGWRIGRWRR